MALPKLSRTKKEWDIYFSFADRLPNIFFSTTNESFPTRTFAYPFASLTDELTNDEYYLYPNGKRRFLFLPPLLFFHKSCASFVELARRWDEYEISHLEVDLIFHIYARQLPLLKRAFRLKLVS